MDALFSGLRLADIHQQLARNIISIRVSQNLFDDLSDDPDDWQVAQQHEMHIKLSTYTSSKPLIDRPFEESDWFNAIEFPFRHWTESRFSDGRFGIWYGSDSVETSVHETVYHWRWRILADAGFDTLVAQESRQSITSERKVYWVQCDAALVDFRQLTSNYPALICPDSYAFTQEIASRLHREGHPGLVSQSARCAGDNFAILNRHVLSNPQACCSLTYRLTPHGVEVERESGRIWMQIPAG